MRTPDTVPRYRTFSAYLRERFHARIYKLSLDAGFSCPNRDGSISSHGCAFCDNRSFSPAVRAANPSLNDQISHNISVLRSRFKAERFIAYFQAHTNTYAPVDQLKAIYDHILPHKDIVSLAIGTRPDCISPEILELINNYTDRYEVWIEYGLQTIHDDTLHTINRGHRAEAFFNAVALTRKYPKIKICPHVIIGLPGETAEMVHETARAIATIHPEGIKIHPLHIVKDTPLAQRFALEPSLPLLSRDEYIDRCVMFLEHLPPQTVIQRLTADCPRDMLIAPKWIGDKNALLDDIHRQLVTRNTRQGSSFKT